VRGRHILTRVISSDVLLLRWSDFIRWLRCCWKSVHITGIFVVEGTVTTRVRESKPFGRREYMLRIRGKVVSMHALKTWERGGIAPFILNLGSRWSRMLSFVHRPLGTLDTLDLASDTFWIGLEQLRTFRRTGKILTIAGNGTAGFPEAKLATEWLRRQELSSRFPCKKSPNGWSSLRSYVWDILAVVPLNITAFRKVEVRRRFVCLHLQGRGNIGKF
jgi:hypothetical protein